MVALAAGRLAKSTKTFETVLVGVSWEIENNILREAWCCSGCVPGGRQLEVGSVL